MYNSNNRELKGDATINTHIDFILPKKKESWYKNGMECNKKYIKIKLLYKTKF